MTSSRPTWADTWMAVARTIGLRSLCGRDQVGAVIVSAENRIIDTGYNGPPRGMGRDRLVARSMDGAVILEDESCAQWCPRNQEWTRSNIIKLESDYSDCPSLHAEANALMFSDRRLRDGGTIYVSSGTCSGCAKLVANSGLTRAVYATTERDISHRDSQRWYDFLETCGVEVVIHGTAKRQATPR